jgi:hypothetical protein
MNVKDGYPFSFEFRNREFLKLVKVVIRRIPIEPEEFPICRIVQNNEIRAKVSGRVGYFGEGEFLVEFSVKAIMEDCLSLNAVIGLIAHEFGHLHLNYLQYLSGRDKLRSSERGADRTAIGWGFKKEIDALRLADQTERKWSDSWWYNIK